MINIGPLSKSQMNESLIPLGLSNAMAKEMGLQSGIKLFSEMDVPLSLETSLGHGRKYLIMSRDND